jgi:carboxyl-terminal processing protease
MPCRRAIGTPIIRALPPLPRAGGALKEPHPVRIKRILAPLLLVGLSGALLAQLPIAIADRAAAYEWFNPIIDVRDTLLRRYATAPDESKMQRAMLEAMVGSLDDPHTVYIPPNDRADFDKQLRGTYVGIGAEVTQIDGYLTIISPMDGSPALEAGIMAGDIVLEIKGKSTFNEPVNDSIGRLVGEPGTPVSVRVRHTDGSEADLTITRRQIVTRTVRGLRRMGEQWNHCVDESLGIHYVRITQFNETTRSELEQVLERLNRRGLNGLVLDLRDNGGGALQSAGQVADLFLDSGQIVSIRDRNGQGPTFAATPEGTLPNFPMVILVNGASASASEIVAGALKENGRAKVLGTRTFGKGSVQEVRELPYDQGVLKFTTAHYHLPSGRNINRQPDSVEWGVDPDPGFVIAVTPEEHRARMLARREYEVIREVDETAPSCAEPSWIREHLLDAQLAVAVEAVQERVRGNPWPAPGGDEPALIAFEQELQNAAERRIRMLEQLEKLENRMAELQELADAAGREPLLPADVDLRAGTITVRDRHGNVIGSFRIEAGDLNMALRGVDLTPIAQP